MLDTGNGDHVHEKYEVLSGSNTFFEAGYNFNLGSGFDGIVGVKRSNYGTEMIEFADGGDFYYEKPDEHNPDGQNHYVHTPGENFNARWASQFATENVWSAKIGGSYTSGKHYVALTISKSLGDTVENLSINSIDLVPTNGVDNSSEIPTDYIDSVSFIDIEIEYQYSVNESLAFTAGLEYSHDNISVDYQDEDFSIQDGWDKRTIKPTLGVVYRF